MSRLKWKVATRCPRRGTKAKKQPDLSQGWILIKDRDGSDVGWLVVMGSKTMVGVGERQGFKLRVGSLHSRFPKDPTALVV